MSIDKTNFHNRLNNIIADRGPLCVGLDPDVNLLPAGYDRSLAGLQSQMSDIIKATADLAAAYKLNTAFFEAFGSAGWDCIETLLNEIRSTSKALVIADAKRGDLKNTARFYAVTFFETFDFDAVTLQPYMGFDSLEPFLEWTDRGSIVLCLTSNQGSFDFQHHGNPPLFLKVAEQCESWNQGRNNMMLVVGATRDGDDMSRIRDVAPSLPFLVPGIGKQGGSLETVLSVCGRHLLINSSRGISTAAGHRSGLIEAARAEAERIQAAVARYWND